ncbi:hypothetical protein KIW84_031170 [Lathyrus oleraceus]|uniref:Uncharacterized protein n=1 Tax=Pisum sativum TaxID=3888 RepID=A0A9D4XV38_PEA|nr:hypothetical protein KIW84_031170 [Pisum sativum]
MLGLREPLWGDHQIEIGRFIAAQYQPPPQPYRAPNQSNEDDCILDYLSFMDQDDLESLEASIIPEGIFKEASRISGVVDLNLREDGPSVGDELGSSAGIKEKVIISGLDGEFEVVRLDDNPTRSVKIGVDLPAEVKEGLVKCLRANTYLFSISSKEMPNIDLSVSCHQLNIHPGSRLFTPVYKGDHEPDRTPKLLRRFQATGHLPRKEIRDYDVFDPNVMNTLIIKPYITLVQFEFKPMIFQMLQAIGQYSETANEDPHLQLTQFLEVARNFKILGITDDAFKLRLFPYSLRDKVKSWMNSLELNSIAIWNALAGIFYS